MLERRLSPFTCVVAAIAFVALYALTVPETTADTPVYVSQILEYYQNKPVAPPVLLWEFGHLLWRPLGYSLWRLTPVLSSWSGENPSIEITLVFLGLNFVIGIALTILLLLLCKRLGLDEPTALGITAGFMLSSTVLNYVHSGMSYNLGFLLQIAALILILRSGEHAGQRELFAVGGGVALALAIAFWFPYVLTVPSILFAAWLTKPINVEASLDARRTHLRMILMAAVVAAFAGVVLFGVGVWIDHLYSYDAIKQWVANSAHGIAPENRLIRLPTGITRSFLYFGDQGIVLKRFVLGDKYAPVHLAELFPALWKVVIVFLALAFILLALARNRRGWPALSILLSGLVPVIAFAVLLFETAEPARYEPAYPSLIVALCALLLLPEGKKLHRRFLAVFLAVMATVNLSAFGWILRSTTSQVSERAMLVHDHASPRGVAFLLSFHDPLSKFVQKAPLSPLNRQNALPLYHVFEPGTARMDTWRHDAGCRILQAWSGGGEAWLSDRLTASRPKPEWEWAEQDDRRLHWADVPDFFLRFDQDGHIGTDDGFFRVAENPKNLDHLRSICAESASK